MNILTCVRWFFVVVFAFAEIYLQALERNHVYKMVNSPRLWLRKVDDTFVITKHDPQQMLEELNSIHPQLKFTSE